MAKKIYLSPSDQNGNLYAYGNTNEMVQCQKIADACEVALKRSGFEVKNNKTAEMEDRVAESNAWGADLHVCIHTNAFNSQVSGTRIISYDLSGAGYKASKAVFDVLAPLTPGTSENVSANPRLYEIRCSNSPCVYVEAEFHDVPKIAKWIIENVVLIGEAIAEGVCNYFGYKYVAPVVKPAETNPSNVFYRVQVGAFNNPSNAEALQRDLIAAGFPGAFITKVEK